MLITEYMKKFISISLFISACFLGSCSSYDDERIWQDLNEIEKTIGDYEAQTETLTGTNGPHCPKCSEVRLSL